MAVQKWLSKKLAWAYTSDVAVRRLHKTSNYGTQGLRALTEVFGDVQRGAMGDPGGQEGVQEWLPPGGLRV